MDWIGWLQVGLLVGIVSAVSFPLTLQARCGGFRRRDGQELESTRNRDIAPEPGSPPGRWQSMATPISR